MKYFKMAAKLAVVLALVALGNSSPAVLKGYLLRDGRGFASGQGFTNGGGTSSGSATISGGTMHAEGSASSDGSQFIRNIGFGEAMPGQVVANAQVSDSPQLSSYEMAKAIADAQNQQMYYPIPPPATIVSYEQNYAIPQQIRYEIPVGLTKAESSAVLNGAANGLTSSVASDASGSAESSAQTQGVGQYGLTSSNAKTFGGVGSASANANNAYGSTITSAKTQGIDYSGLRYQDGLRVSSANSQVNGGYGTASSSVNNAADSPVATANAQGYGAVSSNADINNSLAATKNYGHNAISWRFGTLYGTPSHLQQAVLPQAVATSQASGGTAKSTAQSNGLESSQSSADAQGQGFVNAIANLNDGSYTQYMANNYAFESGVAKTAANTNGYGTANSVANTGLGSVQSTANSNGGYGTANANSDINGLGGLRSTANTNGFGTASSSANGPVMSVFRNVYVPYTGSRSATNAQTSGNGSAASSVDGYRINSSANTAGYGTAQANAQTL
ncbi:nuclear pore complex protein Nup214-like [Leptidea sinapis]|uniref:nuclear pore complex protein Nup214-like n=1 Tax=Leptidea sinapis TaxID=189913 RepID=UPI0021C3606B|nr:nuclear pore complex protein Nup214-like [Leptidea sinapis]